jgi:hypothetical protein
MSLWIMWGQLNGAVLVQFAVQPPRRVSPACGGTTGVNMRAASHRATRNCTAASSAWQISLQMRWVRGCEQAATHP